MKSSPRAASRKTSSVDPALRVAPRLAAVHRLEVLHGEGQSDGPGAAAALDGVDRLAMRGDQDVVGAQMQLGIAASGREEPPAMAERGDDVGLVQRARAGDQIAQVGGGALAEAGEAIRGGRLGPAAARDHPAGRREVVEGDDGLEAVLVARRAHAAVVVERGAREVPVLRLDAAPLEREAIRGESERREQPHVVGVAVVVVAGVGARLHARACPACAPRPTSRCSSCRPPPGAPRWRCPTRSRRGTRGSA